MGTSPIQSTFIGKGGSSDIGDANFRIESCVDSVEYLIDSSQLCEFGNLSLNPTTVHVGDYVQFTDGTDCSSATTYCALVIQAVVSGTPTALLTSSELMNDCMDFRCMQ